MTLSAEQLNQVIAHIKAKNFVEASSIIAAKQDTSDIIRDAIEEALEKLPPTVTAAIIQNIAEVYDKYSNSLPQLESALDSIISSGVVDLKSNTSGPIILKDLQQLTDDQLCGTIGRIRTEQNHLVSKGETPDAELAKKLHLLLSEKRRRSNPEAGKKIILESSSKPVAEVSPEAIKNWFVLPDMKELESKDDVSVVIGSPVIEILRKRYIKKNK